MPATRHGASSTRRAGSCEIGTGWSMTMRLGGKRHMKRRSLSQLAANLEFGIVTFERVFDNSKAEPDTTVVTASARIHTEESLGQAGDMFFGNTLAGIRNDQFCTVRTAAPGQSHACPPAECGGSHC